MFILFPIAAAMVLEPTQNDQVDYLKAELMEIQQEEARWDYRFGVDWIDNDGKT